MRTLQATRRELELTGHRVELVTPLDFLTVPCPGYREIRLAVAPYRGVAHRIEHAVRDERRCAIHIATEGPLGWAARRYCRRRGLPFTTAYHTRFPQYLNAMFGIPESWVYGFLRRFHGRSARVLSATVEVDRELARIGVTRVARWTRGVDANVFRPHLEESPLVADCPRPRFLYAGRVAVEKNIEASICPARLSLPATARSGRACSGASRERVSSAC